MVEKILRKQPCRIIIEDLRHRKKRYKKDAERLFYLLEVLIKDKLHIIVQIERT